MSEVKAERKTELKTEATRPTLNWMDLLWLAFLAGLAALPALVLGTFSLIQPGYATTLFRDPVGFRLLEVAAGLDLMALITIRQLLRVNY
jgi:hypothetical protein